MRPTAAHVLEPLGIPEHPTKDHQPAVDLACGLFSRTSWRTLAPFAWRGYERGGRGAVVAPWSVARLAPSVYLGARPPLLVLGYVVAMPNTEAFMDALMRYNPEREILLLLLGDDDFAEVRAGRPTQLRAGYVIWQAAHDPAPPVAAHDPAPPDGP